MTCNIDITMHSPQNSPPRLYGASRTTGGIIRGRAFGNTVNAADICDEVTETLFPVPSKVLVFSSADDPANLNVEQMKPTLFIKHLVTPTIQPVLSKISGRFSPIQSQTFPKLIQQTLINFHIENHIFTFEEGLWNARGRYIVACQDDDELVWSTINGEHITHILSVGVFCLVFVSFLKFLNRVPSATLLSPQVLHLLMVHIRLHIQLHVRPLLVLQCQQLSPLLPTVIIYSWLNC